MKRMLMLGVILIALATAAPALADPGQSATQSAGTVQVDSTAVSPSVSTNTPTNANTPVCVASDCQDASADQTGGGATSSTSSNTGGQDGQTVDHSAVTVQTTNTDASPAVSANAPINTNTPVCVASDCSGSTAGQSTGASEATTDSSGQSQTGGQTTNESIGTAQIDQASVSPAAAANAPINTNTPVCVASDCSGTNADQSPGGGEATSQTTGQSQTGDQTTNESIGTAQIDQANVSPAAAANAPTNTNTPVCVASDCSGTTAGQSPGGGGTGSDGGGTTDNGPPAGGGPPSGGEPPTGSQAGGSGGTHPGGTIVVTMTPGTVQATAGPSTAGSGPSAGVPGTTSKVSTTPATHRRLGVVGTSTSTRSGVLATARAQKPAATAASGAEVVQAQLPFSGLALPYALAVALALLLAGVGLRRLAGQPEGGCH